MELIPSILTNSITEARELVARCEGVTKRAHIDIIDGQFADNKTIVPSDFSDFDTGVLLDYHLMVQEPIRWLEQCLRGQAGRVIAQVEHMSDQVEFIKQAQVLGINIGFALDLDTPVEAIEREILTDLDVVLVMSVKAGFGGQKFRPEVLDKVTKLALIKAEDQSPFRICVDGGETTDTIDETAIAGADEVAIGRRLFQGDLKQNIEKFLKAI